MHVMECISIFFLRPGAVGMHVGDTDRKPPKISFFFCAPARKPPRSPVEIIGVPFQTCLFRTYRNLTATLSPFLASWTSETYRMFFDWTKHHGETTGKPVSSSVEIVNSYPYREGRWYYTKNRFTCPGECIAAERRFFSIGLLCMFRRRKSRRVVQSKKRWCSSRHVFPGPRKMTFAPPAPSPFPTDRWVILLIQKKTGFFSLCFPTEKSPHFVRGGLTYFAHFLLFCL